MIGQVKKKQPSEHLMNYLLGQNIVIGEDIFSGEDANTEVKMDMRNSHASTSGPRQSWRQVLAVAGRGSWRI